MIAALERILARRRLVLAVLLAALAFGIVSYVTIPKEARPDIQVPVFYISIPLPGIAPEDAERLLVRPMEKELKGLEGLKELTAVASQGHAGIILEFDADVDPDLAARKVREKVDLAKAELPEDAEEPVIEEVNFSLFPSILVAVSGNVPERVLYRHARELADALEAIPEVLEARLSGEREELVEVVIDDLKLNSYGLAPAEIMAAIRGHNRLVAAGAVEAAGGRFQVKVPGLFRSLADVRAVPLRTHDGAVITLGDVAEIRRTFKDRKQYAFFNGRPSISIEVVKRVGANIIATNDKVRATAREVTRDWPEAIHVDFAFDESARIGTVLGSLENSIMTAIILVMIICVAALGLRSALLVGLAIPTSFMIAFAIAGLLGRTMNNMMLFGLVLTVGMLVDGAIVIVEYADRKMAEGLSPREAYVAAARRMFWPVTSSTATTLAAFLPMLFWPGVPGKFMSNLPITVVIVLSASLLTAMVFLPVVGGLFARRPKDTADVMARLGPGALNDIDHLPGLTGTYARTLRHLIARPGWVLVAAALLLGGIFATYARHNAGMEFFVDTEPEKAIVYIRARGNLSAEEKMRLVRKVEAEVAKVKGLKTIAVLSGSAGPSGLGSGTGLDQPKDAIGRITVELKPLKERRPGREILAEIAARAASVPGVITEVRKFEEGPPTGKDIRLQVRAQDHATAIAVAGQVRAHMERMGGLKDIEDERPLPGMERVLVVDREETGRYGADVVALGALVRLVTNGVLVGTWRPDDAGDEVDIRVRLPGDERTLDRLSTLRIVTPLGLVPVTHFIREEVRPRVDAIIRKDGSYSVYVKANVQPGERPEIKIRELSHWLESQSWPAGVRFRFRGADEEQKKSAAFLKKALMASVFIMFLILVAQFDSYYHAFLTLSTLVMSVAGVLLGMLVTGQKFSVIMTGTGIIALAGIVVNNAIVLIDTYHLNRRRGLREAEAALISAVQRLRPVLLTTVTTIFGLLPMVFEFDVDWIHRTVGIGNEISSWWVQLATALVSGLAFATLLTLVLTPVLLAAPARWRKAWPQSCNRGDDDTRDQDPSSRRNTHDSPVVSGSDARPPLPAAAQ